MLLQVDANGPPMLWQQDSNKDLLHSAAADMLLLPIPREEGLIIAVQAHSPDLHIEWRDEKIPIVDAVIVSEGCRDDPDRLIINEVFLDEVEKAMDANFRIRGRCK